jgi:hypothetical protein
MCVGTRGWRLKGASNHIKKDNNMVKPMNFIFWPHEVMQSHKVLHIGTISTPMFRKRDLHPPSPPPPQENVIWLEGMNDDDDDDNQGQTNNEWVGV